MCTVVLLTGPCLVNTYWVELPHTNWLHVSTQTWQMATGNYIYAKRPATKLPLFCSAITTKWLSAFLSVRMCALCIRWLCRDDCWAAAGTANSARMPWQRACQMPGPGARGPAANTCQIASHVQRDTSERSSDLSCGNQVHAYGCGCWWCMCFGKRFQCESGCFGTVRWENRKQNMDEINWNFSINKMEVLFCSVIMDGCTQTWC